MIGAGDGDPVEELFALYRERGDGHYDEAVTQTEHALQAAELARRDGAADALVVAALLHDVGHLLEAEDSCAEADLEHELVGARLLGRWFPPEVTAPIALHVPAKRYLVATDLAYAAGLSPASVRSLTRQGGPMDADECAAFARRGRAEDACRLRRWDDAAKVPGAATASLADHRDTVRSLVTTRPR